MDSSYTVTTLLDRGLIEAAGRLEAPGRPTLYRTSDLFLRTMGMTTLEELPVLPDMTSGEGAEKLQAAIQELQSRGEQISLEQTTESEPTQQPEEAPAEE